MATKKPVSKTQATKLAKAVGKARTTKARVKLAGKTTRMKGHVSARGRRSQARRDQKNA